MRKGFKTPENIKNRISNSLKGHSFSENTILKIKKTIRDGYKNGRIPWNKGKKMPQFSGSNHPNWKGGLPRCIDCGKQLSGYGKRERCDACYRRFMCGNKSHLWKGGKMKNYSKSEQIRKSTEYTLWRKVIFERDRFICQKCGQKGGELVAHHINNFADFPELRLALDNGIILCKKCHTEFHKIYGKGNNTKEQLEEFSKNN